MTILITYDAVVGEKKEGTLRLVLSNSISKLSLFCGKYFGLMAVVLISLVAGVIINLVAVSFFADKFPGLALLWPVAWTILYSALYLSFFVFAGLAVSSNVKSTSVSLVLLLVIWAVIVFVIPGFGRLIAEQTVPIPSQADVRNEMNAASRAINDAAPNDANFVRRNVFDPKMQLRAKLWNDLNDASLRISDQYVEKQINQVLNARVFGFLSPFSLYSDSVQKFGGTGVYGFINLHRNVRRYRTALYNFIVNKDAADSTTPHLVYGGRGFFDTGTFSNQPVNFEEIPRAETLWNDLGTSDEYDVPWITLILLITSNLYAAGISGYSLLKYDPR
jgi:ABC-type transport system involved in multi-copper enzyme maturation permease subunit